MTYVQGFLVPCPLANKAAYAAHASGAVPLFHECGVTRMVEAWGDDVPVGKVNDFHGAVARKEDEAVLFSWCEYPDKATYQAANEKMMADPRMAEMPPMPFDGKRMVFGGFEPIVDEGAGGGTGYVDGFVLPVPADKRDAYREVARKVAPIFRDHGVTRYVEAWGDDVPHGEVTDFYRAAHAQDGDSVVFAWCEWPDKAARDAGMAAIMADARMQGPHDDVPFDGRRVVFGGFSILLDTQGGRGMSAHLPIWYELLTTDADAAQVFYADVAGWRIAGSGMPGMDYRILTAPYGDAVGGLMPRPDGMAAEPAWLTYLAVADVDAKADEVVAAGGAVHMPPMTLDGVGRMALLADPWGAAFYVMTPAEQGESRAFQAGDAAQPGHAVWNELSTPEQDAAIAFYAEHFGWRQEGAMPMGELGDYRFIHSGSTCVGAVMRELPGMKAGWQPYFLVPDIDAAVARVTAGGGTVLQGPDQIPGGSYSLVVRDPQGATVGFVGERKAAVS